MTLNFFQALDLFESIVGGVVAAIVLSLLAIWIAKRMGLIDVPGTAAHKQHAWPTPLAGGIAMVLSMLVLLTIFSLWQKPFSSLMAATAIVFVFGLWDDSKGLSAPKKLAGQTLASIVLIASGNYVKFLSGFDIEFLPPSLITILSWGITIIWLVGITNSINLIDSMDGLALGVSGITFAFFIGMTVVSQQLALARFCGILLGICIGLYVYNISPARLFLGDSGAQTLGFILAAVAFMYTPKDFPQASSWFVPIMVLGVPVFDTTLVVISRLRHHKPVFRGDRSHVYHRLITLGLAPGRAVLIVHMASLILSCLAFVALYLVPWKANLVFALTVMVGIGLLIFLELQTQNPGEIHG